MWRGGSFADGDCHLNRLQENTMQALANGCFHCCAQVCVREDRVDSRDQDWRAGSRIRAVAQS